MYIVRCSRPEVFCIKDVLKNTAKFTEKRQGPSLFLHIISDLRFAILLTLIWVVVVVVVVVVVGGDFTLRSPSCWFSFNNSETVKAVTLAFRSI